MSLAAMNDSMPSGEFSPPDADRAAEIDRRQESIANFLAEQDLHALLITRPSNFAWFTVGGDSTYGFMGEPTAALFVNRDARVLLTQNTDSQRLFDCEVPSLGFQMKERSWLEDRTLLMADLCRGRNVGADISFERCRDVSSHLATLRLPFAKLEIQRLRELGLAVVHAVEATARTFLRGETEAEITGQVAHRMLRLGVQPIRIQVAADGRTRWHRHSTSGDETIHRTCTISAIGRRHGLHVGLSRTVSFGAPPKEVRDAHLACVLVQATGMYFSQAKRGLSEAWSRVQRIYEKFGHGEEWYLSQQGCVTGYEQCESPIVPKSPFRLASGIPIQWHVSIGSGLVDDTILIQDAGFEVITQIENWPQTVVDIKQVKVPRPDILVRPA